MVGGAVFGFGGLDELLAFHPPIIYLGLDSFLCHCISLFGAWRVV